MDHWIGNVSLVSIQMVAYESIDNLCVSLRCWAIFLKKDTTLYWLKSYQKDKLIYTKNLSKKVHR
jgi:hypothetical protein